MMSYRTKSSLAALLALGLVYGAYFLWAGRPGHSPSDILHHMIGAVVILTVVMIGLGVAIALRDVAVKRSSGVVDERDRAIELRSARNGFYALMGLLWLAPFVALAGVSPVLMANLSLAVLVVAEMVHFGSRAAYDLLDA